MEKDAKKTGISAVARDFNVASFGEANGRRIGRDLKVYRTAITSGFFSKTSNKRCAA